ncbi:phosphate ABC transporter substrate-binding protein (PhoT family) [Alicyclobacillus sacchari]|uniref:Phosphate-binding protein n=1 Tax=Alicyclobacillus sacchari TaxID=392010 RepID=A0A4R8LNR7_9BACL|nr:phosphate ABC transporter substrate-binding protein PstS [Alicyclobacillus sacchari]TDY47922.1 phosphate ABC transporter substrate-binding protein (PhoT family) [Alicyclobacillus sacchari]GMA56028.1 phosphate-binding protein PstS 1 [Alicyclobacillus sacchari]
MKLHHTKWFAGAAVFSAWIAVSGCGTTATNNSSNITTKSVENTAANQSAAKTTATVSLSETGSSLLYPLFNTEWIPAYHKVQPSVQITAASTGSGTGISDATAGTVDIGASDAYMADAQMAQTPGMLNIPVAISAQQVMYNLPGVKGHIHLNGAVLAQIYEGKVTYWDDKNIRALNPGVSLPHQLIKPVYRSDGSGDTFLFTQYLSHASANWSQQYGYGTSISWPGLATAIGAKGNDGVVAALSKTKYSVGYVGISWLDKAVQAGLAYAALQNRAGQYVLPTTSNIQAAAAAVKQVPSDERVSLIDEPGADSYPIINFEYLIVKKTQPSASTAHALQGFLKWAIDPAKGNAATFLTPVHFLPLPANIFTKSQAQIAQITG